MSETAMLCVRVSPEEKNKFVETASVLGLSASDALKILIQEFNRFCGFPFEVRKAAQINFSHPNLFRPKLKGNAVILPAPWRGDGDED